MYIGLQFIIYEKDSGNLVMYHPSIDKTVDVKMKSTAMMVSDEDITYDMTVMMFEGLNTLGTVLIEQGVVESGGHSKFLLLTVNKDTQYFTPIFFDDN